MSTRGRGYAQNWDPMREDYDNSAYDPQYPDDNSSGYVNLDHCRLYIRNIPAALNEDGIQAAFSKFGQLKEIYVSKDPHNKYGLIAFETPGEAKMAMMKLNRTEPLGLNIRIAHKKKTKDNQERVPRGHSERDGRNYRDDSSSVDSRSHVRRQEDLANGDNMEDVTDDDVGLNNLDPDMELEQLKLEHLKLQEAQLLCKQRMFLLRQAEKKSSSSRCILPDGRIVVRNVEKAETVRDTDTSFGAGAGDSRVAQCVACGERAESFCAGCGVTPYCSPGCQRRDWADRHRMVCHNVKRLSGAGVNVSQSEPEKEIEPVLQAAPLRRPRSPDLAKREPRDENPGLDRVPSRRFGPPGSHVNVPTSPNDRGNYRNTRGAMPRLDKDTTFNRSDDGKPKTYKDEGNEAAVQKRSDDDDKGKTYQGDRNKRTNDNDAKAFQDRARNRPDDGDKSRTRYQSNDANRPNQERNGRYGPKARTDDNNRSGGRVGGDRNSGGRFENRRPVNKEEEEEWNAKPEQNVTELPKPSFKPKSPQVQTVEPKFPPKTAQEVSKEVPKEVRDVKPSTADVTRTLVPKNCVVELLQNDAKFTLSVDAEGAACRAGGGFVCLSLHENYSEQYMQLLDDAFTQRCEASDPIRPTPGDTFAYLNPQDGGWYRARCLTPALAALLDGSKLVDLNTADKCKKLAAEDCDVPEFCCLLEAAKVEVNDKLNCTVISKSGSTLTVSLTHLETGAALGSGKLTRWQPLVEYPQPSQATAKPASNAVPANYIPDVPRPPVADNSRVILIDATSPGRLFVRSSERDKQTEFDDVITEVALYGASATPLQEPPVKGQTVVAKFIDGNHYRAMCRRVNSKLNKYLLEYVEYGNEAVSFLEDLYPCPLELQLDARPTVASHVALQMEPKSFTAAAVEYLDRLKDDAEELTLKIPSGKKAAPRGTAVRLSIAKSGEDVGRAVTALCTPEWKKLLDRGGDVLEIEPLFFKDIEYVDLPASGCELEIVDTSLLQGGMLSGYVKGAPHVAKVFALSAQLEEYCNSELCKDPYLPKSEELCIALCPTRKQWVRAALLQQHQGAGGGSVDLLQFDYGHVVSAPVGALRKALPEFVRGLPAAVCSLELRDFPKELTAEQLSRALRHLQVNEQGRGTLRVARCTKLEPGEFGVVAPDLIRAINQ